MTAFDRNDLLLIISTLVDDIGHFRSLPGRVRSLTDICQMLNEPSLPTWLRDTCAYALGQLAINSPEVLDALHKASSEPNNVGKCAWNALSILEKSRIE